MGIRGRHEPLPPLCLHPNLSPPLVHIFGGKRGRLLHWFFVIKPSASRSPGSLSHKPSEHGLSPEGSGEPLKVLVKGGPGQICALEQFLWLLRDQEWGQQPRETEEAVPSSRGLPVKGTDHVGGETATKWDHFPEGTVKSCFFLISAWLSKCVTQWIIEWLLSQNFWMLILALGRN